MLDKALSLLGLAMKAGKIASGEVAVENAIKSGTACLVIVARDGSDNTRKKFRDSCTFYEVDFIEYSDKENLGRVLGKDMRSSVAITDEGLAKAFMKKIKEVKEEM